MRRRCLTLRRSFTVFSQPKISSLRLRFFWLRTQPSCRVVRASIALARLLVFWAMCGVIPDRSQASDEGIVVIGAVRRERAARRSWLSSEQQAASRSAYP